MDDLLHAGTKSSVAAPLAPASGAEELLPRPAPRRAAEAQQDPRKGVQNAIGGALGRLV